MIHRKMKGWSWFSLLYKLAGGDYLKIPEVGKTNFIGALNFLAYQRTQENYIEALKKKMNG